jgi:hypothetical protein
MSESNPPIHNPGEPNSEPTAWRDPFTGMYEDDSEINSLFNSLAATEATPSPDLPPDEPTPSQPPELADLISLIQELNQCNSALLDRVSQLEDALEQSQSTLALAEPAAAPMPQDLPKAQEQITTLYNQLEFAHQTNQRQQILLETLTAQLEASQERVAQLERETSLVQQRYTEQVQTLTQTESSCRELQARLHRQQRYTLQFKAALEKCLEVPMPQYEGQEAPSATAGDYLFLPKAQRIKPWTAPTDTTPKLPWMNLAADAIDTFQTDPKLTHNLHLPTFALPDLPQPEAPIEAPPESAVAPTPESAVAPTVDAAIALSSTEQADLEHIHSVVQPLADLIAEAMLAAPFPVDALQPATVELPLEVAPPVAPVEAAIEAVEAPQPAPAPPIFPVPMADAEDALWQDLARLIDVSTEDVVKASLSGDFAAFEAIDFTALEPAPEPSLGDDPWDDAIAPPVAPQLAVPQAPDSPFPPPVVPVRSVQPPAPSPAPTPATVPAFVATSQNSPSPVVYPLRPTKKRQSLAMVELPDFRGPRSNPMPT